MTPRAGEKIRETERERFVGRGAWGWPWGDHMDVKGVRSSHRSCGNYLLQTPWS